MLPLASGLVDAGQSIDLKNFADFSADVRYGDIPFTVNFKSRDIESINSWLWDFGDGETSLKRNPSHIYGGGFSKGFNLGFNAIQKEYDIQLTMVNQLVNNGIAIIKASNIKLKTDYIESPKGTLIFDSSLLLHCNGIDGSVIFTDATGRHTVSAQGNAQIDTAQKKFGTASGLFDGIGDYLSIPDSADWNMGTGNFTIDFWVRFNNLPALNEDMGFFEQRVDANNRIYCYTTRLGTGDYNIQFNVEDSGSEIIAINNGGDGTFTPIVNTWHHLAIIRGWNGNANDWAISFDGVVVATLTDSSSMPNIAAAFEIGRYLDAVTYDYLDGWIDEFSILKGAARWTSNFTSPTKEYVETEDSEN